LTAPVEFDTEAGIWLKAQNMRLLGLTRLTKVTILSPRSESEDVAKVLAQFENLCFIVALPSNQDSL